MNAVRVRRKAAHTAKKEDYRLFSSSLREMITNLLLPIAYDGENGVHNLVGLIMNEDAYKERHGANFPTPICLDI